MTCLIHWACYGLVTAGTGIALGAVQLLPNLELAAASLRTVGHPPTWDAVIDGTLSLCQMIGPPLTHKPSYFEYPAAFGLLLLSLAVLAPLLRGGRTRYQAGVCLLLMVYALGGAVLLQGLPGFRLFRVPARMFMIASLPVALLAGTAIQALSNGVNDKQRAMCRRAFGNIVVAVLILHGGYALLRHLQGHVVPFYPYWFAAPFLAFAAILLLRHEHGTGWAWSALVVADVAALSLPFVEVRAQADIFAPSACVSALSDVDHERPGRVLDRAYLTIEAGKVRSLNSPLWPALSMKNQIETLGGFNPLDLRLYKEYLQFIGDRDEPLVPFKSAYTFPILGYYPLRQAKFLELLGVRYILQPQQELQDDEIDIVNDPHWRVVSRDETPRTFDLIAGGYWQLPPYAIYENDNVFPRAFVVHQSEPLAPREQVLEQLKSTDFQRTVLLDAVPTHALTMAVPTKPRVATITSTRPNEVVISVAPGEAGYLVLNDLWFPGWKATVNGDDAPVLRANYAFRAVAVPSTECEVVFRMTSTSFTTGRAISLATVAVVIVLTLVGLARRSAW
jgi:hypothetical protein